MGTVGCWGFFAALMPGLSYASPIHTALAGDPGVAGTSRFTVLALMLCAGFSCVTLLAGVVVPSLPISRFPLTSQPIKRNLDGSIFGWLSW